MRVRLDGLEWGLRRDVVTALAVAGCEVVADGDSIDLPGEAVDVVVASAATLPEALRATVDSRSDVAVVVVAALEDPEDARELLAAGVRAIVDPRAGSAVVAASIVACAAGQCVVPQAVIEVLSARLDPLPPLDPIERELLLALVSHSVEGAARAVSLSKRTAERRLDQIRKRVGLRSHWELAAAAGRWGLWPGRSDPNTG